MRKLPLLLFLLYAKVAFGQVTYSAVTIAFPHIVAGGDPNGGHYVTLLQIVNNNSAATTGHVSMFSDSGTPLAVLFDTQGPQSTIDIKLDGGQSRQIQINLNGPVTAGWMTIVYSPSDALTTVLLDSLSRPKLHSEVGTEPASDVMAVTDSAAPTQR